MISNRSVPVNSALPHLLYRDVEKAIAWLSDAFGLVEHYRYGDPVSGAQMHLGSAWLMLKRAPHADAVPKSLGFGTQSLTIFVEDIQAHYQHAQFAGVTIVEELHETVYGELQYGAEDLDGHRWLFSRHARDVNPAEWGATVAHAAVLPPQISPMLAVADAEAAIRFYQAAFDARVLWSLGNSEHMVARLDVHGAPFFLATEAPPYGTRGPAAAGFTTVRIELFVDDPEAVHRQALATGATLADPVREHTHATVGPSPIRRMLQGAVIDPSGHRWLIGKFLE